MQALKKTGTDFSTSRGMNPKQFFEIMGKFSIVNSSVSSRDTDRCSVTATGLNEIVDFDARAGSSTFAAI